MRLAYQNSTKILNSVLYINFDITYYILELFIEYA